MEVRTYRYVGHSMSDAAHGTYRTKDEVEEYRKRDPIAVLGTQMREAGLLNDDSMAELETDVMAEVLDAEKFAEDSPEPELAELTRDVYAPAGES
jgi:pyruvate dehydrogenase E1 component alpha subunit